ncbi:MAG: hypothetical protein KatS3mg019_1703 [Fimbriimonadales bacterium]|nr:MAG: hypothetical protein KatS3mg019_1703 [Fimbriimonadales bacterium]
MRTKHVLWIGAMMWATWGAARADTKTTYFDTREQVATRQTFEWQVTTYAKASPKLIEALNQISLHRAQTIDAPSAPQIEPEVANKVFELSDYYTVARTPQRTLVRAIAQAINLTSAPATDSAIFLNWEAYFQGDTVVVVNRDLASSQVGSVDIVQCDDEALGMGSPAGNIYPEWLAIYSGISLFRLYGRKPEDWRLVSVSPQEWVFELGCQPQDDAVKVRLHLDRRYQDALAQLEVRYPDGEVRLWRVVKYERIESVWFPSEVEFIAQGGSHEARSRAVLVRHKRTQAVELPDIPEKTVVRDWRRLGRKAWEQSNGFEETEWNAALLDSIKTPAEQRSR